MQRCDVQAQLSPLGMHVIYLPCEDDYRNAKAAALRQYCNDPQEPPHEAVHAAEKRLLSLDLDMPDGYEPEAFPIPRLALHYRAVEHMGSNGIMLENENDLCDAKYPQADMTELIGCPELAKDFLKAACGAEEPFLSDKPGKHTDRKRIAWQANDASSSQQPTEQMLMNLASNGSLSKALNKSRSAALCRYGLKESGNKDEQARRLAAALGLRRLHRY